MPAQPPNPDNLKDTVGKLDQSISYVIQVLRGNNWTAKLLLIDVLLFTLFNPLIFTSVLKLLGTDKLPKHYTLYFWLTITIVFALAVASAWRRRAKEERAHAPGERSAVKGLLPYSKDDSIIFARLQREQDLKEILQAITAADFRLGVLCGESGTGKTSFLQAALWPALAQNHYRCVYVKCTDLDPVEAIRQAVTEQLADSESVRSAPDFGGMLDATARLDTTPLVVVLDQFEQFFVHRPHRKLRTGFFAAMEQWYVRRSAFAVKIVICLRSDFLDRLIELQKLLGYSLGPHQNFRLDKFAPAQAAEIFRAIAEYESLDCDSSFVERMAAEELASVSDGLVSPVDIQILSWMVAGQKTDDERAFDESTFRKVGGVEGLLERFLNRALDARETDQRREAAVKVLLGLTDLDRNTRAGVLTSDELGQKLGESLPRAEIDECIEWLSRNDVRLIAPVYRKEADNKIVTGYELAHERLIPALRRIAGKQLGEANRADLLLNRRTNEWLGSGRSSRYLFSWSEMRLINRHRILIAWGKEEGAKKALLARSQRRIRLRLTATGLAMILAVFGWLGWNSNRWQIWLLKRDLRTYGENSSDNHSLYDIAKAFVYAGDSQYVDELLAKMSLTYGKPEALIALAKIYVTLNDKERVTLMLQEAIKTDERIRVGPSGESTLKPVCNTFIRLATKLNDRKVFANAVETAQLIKDDDEKDTALFKIAASISNLAKTTRDNAMLAEGVKVARLIEDRGTKVDALRGLADSYAYIGDSDGALVVLQETSDFVRNYNPSSKAEQLLSKAESYASIGNKDRAADSLDDAVSEERRRRQAPYYKALALCGIADSYLTLQKKESATLLLAEAANLKDNGSYKADMLRSIAESYEKLGDMHETRTLRGEVNDLGRRYDSSLRFETLVALLKGFIKLGDKGQGQSAFTKLLEELGSSYEGVSKICEITGSYDLPDKKETARQMFPKIKSGKNMRLLPGPLVRCLLDKDQLKAMIVEDTKSAELVNPEREKWRALNQIVEHYGELGVEIEDPALLANLIPLGVSLDKDFGVSTALVSLTQNYTKLAQTMNDSALLQEAVNTLRLITSNFDKASILRQIANAYVKLNDKVQARGLLKEARKAVAVESDGAGPPDTGQLDELKSAHQLYEIAKLYVEMGDNEESRELLEKVLKTKGLSTEESPNTELVREIADCYVRIGDIAKARMLLVQAVEAAELNTSDSSKADDLSSIVTSYAKLAEPTNDIDFYHDTFRFIERIREDDERFVVFKAILSSKLAISDVGRVRALISHFTSEGGRAKALSELMIAVSHPELIGKEAEGQEGEEEEEEEEEEDSWITAYFTSPWSTLDQIRTSARRQLT